MHIRHHNGKYNSIHCIIVRTAKNYMYTYNQKQITPNFLPPLRLLDHTLRIELSKSKEYGKKLSIIYSCAINDKIR